MRRHIVEIVLCLGGSALSGCSGPAERPTAAMDCNDVVCEGVRANGVRGVRVGAAGSSNLGAGGGGSSGAGGAGGAGFSQSARSVLAGTVSVVSQPDSNGSGSPSESVQVRTAGQGIVALAADVETDGSFRLDGVPEERPIWVSVGLENNESSGTYIDTMQPVPTEAGAAVALRVVQRSVVEDIVSQSFQSTPLSVDPTGAHAILSIATAEGDRVQGASLITPGLAVAYDAGVIYSDVVEATSVRGSLVIVNAVAPAFPGESTELRFDVDGQQHDFRIYLARGSVTLATLELSQ